MNRSIADVLSSEDRLRLMRDEARRLERLQARLEALLPEGVSGCCSVAALRDGLLTIVASSPAVATAVRQISPRLSAQMRQNEPQVTGMRVVVQPRDARPRPSPPAVRQSTLTEAARQEMLALSSNVRDPRLSAALRALATRRRPAS
ncbi:MAG: DciA family protein [Pseudomonadota bacterium]